MVEVGCGCKHGMLSWRAPHGVQLIAAHGGGLARWQQGAPRAAGGGVAQLAALHLPPPPGCARACALQADGSQHRYDGPIKGGPLREWLDGFAAVPAGAGDEAAEADAAAGGGAGGKAGGGGEQQAGERKLPVYVDELTAANLTAIDESEDMWLVAFYGGSDGECACLAVACLVLLLGHQLSLAPGVRRRLRPRGAWPRGVHLPGLHRCWAAGSQGSATRAASWAPCRIWCARCKAWSRSAACAAALLTWQPSLPGAWMGHVSGSRLHHGLRGMYMGACGGVQACPRGGR